MTGEELKIRLIQNEATGTSYISSLRASDAHMASELQSLASWAILFQMTRDVLLDGANLQVYCRTLAEFCMCVIKTWV